MEQHAADTLNDLILINNDRIKGYEQVLKNLKPEDRDLEIPFLQLEAQSRHFNDQLTKLVLDSGLPPETGTSVSGRLHRRWMDIKATFSGNSRESLLIECERGEDASKEAYGDALHEDNMLNDLQLNVIATQAAQQLSGHDQIKALRDEAIRKSRLRQT
jgi:uncharacterized protein (TIGR02284 family)